MNDWTVRIYLYELHLQCQLALMAATDWQAVLELRQSSPPKDFAEHEERTLRFWSSLQAFLSATGNISKMLWPGRSGEKKRGEQLRLLLSVAHDSPLRPRDYRNAFEHIDERLDEWERQSKTHKLSYRNIGPLDAISGVSLEDFLAYFDTSNCAVIFLGKSSGDLREHIQAVESLHRLLIAELTKPLHGF